MAEHYNRNLSNGFNNNRNYQNGNGERHNEHKESIEKSFNVKLIFNEKEEITDDKGTNYVDIAKDVILSICENDKNGEKKCKMSTNQIRNILSFLSVIFQNIRNDNYDGLSSDINLLRIKLLYTDGRNKDDKEKVYCSKFIKNGNLIELVGFVDNKNKFINYYHYMEALVAWHKYYGGKE